MDSYSSDNSFGKAKKLTEDYDWIYVIKQIKLFEEGYGHKNFSQSVNEGYDYAKSICIKKKIKYEYIGKVDAAISLNYNYFEILVKEMEKNKNLAFTCGILFHSSNNDVQVEFRTSNLSKLAGVHDMRLYRKDFFKKVDGYPISYSPDTILSIKALSYGFDFKVVEETYCEKKRLGGVGGSKIGIWRAYKIKGHSMYYLGYNFSMTFLNAIYNSYKYSPHYQVFPLLYGYLCSFMKRNDIIDDQEVKEYFKRNNINNMLKSYLWR